MGTGLEDLLDRIIFSYDKWNTRVSTGLLNDWLEKFKKLEHLPKDNEHNLRINYIIQGRVRPPHFIFFVNAKHLFLPAYLRFLMRNLSK
jgi:GTP-binding protein